MHRNGPDSLTALRATASRLLVGLLWLSVPVSGAIALLLGTSPWLPVAMAAAAAAIATLMVWHDPAGLATRATVTVASVSVPAQLVALLAGHPWQIDMHMAFFAVLAVLATYADWRMILLGAAVTACHHLALNVMLPALVFPGGADLVRVVLHAAIVVVEAGALIWLTHRIATVLPAAERAAREAAESASAVAQLTAEREAEAARAEAARREEAALVADRFQAEMGGVVAEVEAAAAGMDKTAGMLAEASSRAGREADEAASAAARSARGVQSAAAAVEEMSASIGEITRRIGEAASVSGEAARSAGTVEQTVANLAKAARRIGAVAGMIGGVAGQTNLLALNATIEAARAGEAGKGFAVVANEVKGLAAETAKATEEIAREIAAMQAATDDTGRAVGEIIGVVRRIDGIASAIAAAMEEQAAAIGEIGRAVQAAAAGTDDSSAAIATVSAAAGENAEIARRTRESARALSATAEVMAERLDTFLGSLRAA
jgi:methyl-accepting chemotaxis protein